MINADDTTSSMSAGVSGMTRRGMAIFLGALLLSMLLAALGQNGVATALPTVAGKLGGLQQLSWVVTAYLIAMAAATPMYGKLSDLRGPKQMLLFAIATFTVGSMLSGISQNMGQLIASRGVQGIGAGGVIAMSFTIGSQVVPPRETGRYQWASGIVWAIATLIGPPVSGFLTQHASWRWVFIINVPVGVAAFAATAALLRLPPPEQRPRHHVDYPGAALVVASSVCLLLIVVWGGQRYAWGSAPIVALSVSGAALVVAFVVREHYAAEPILMLSLFRSPVVSVAFTTIFLVGAAMFAGSVFLPMYLQVVKGIPPASSGLYLIPLWVAVTIASFISGWVIARTGRYRLVIVAGAGLVAIGLYLFSRLDRGSQSWVIFAGEVVLGCGLGSVISKLIMAVQNVVRRSEISVAVSATQFFRELGGAFGTAIFGAMLTARLDYWQSRLLAAGLRNGNAAVRYKDPQSVDRLAVTDPVLYHGLTEMLDRSLHAVFLAAVPFAVAAFLLSWWLPEVRLQSADTWRAADHGEKTVSSTGLDGSLDAVKVADPVARMSHSHGSYEADMSKQREFPTRRGQ